MTEEGVKRIAGGDFKTKFREIIWTADINKEMPIMIAPDKSLLILSTAQGLEENTPKMRIPGSE